MSRKTYNLGQKFIAQALVTLPDSTSQKFLLLGSIPKGERTKESGRIVVIYLDFQPTRGRKCEDDDFEKWYARKDDSECIMGHKVCHFLLEISVTSTTN